MGLLPIIIKVVSIALIVTVIIIVVKQQRPELAVQLSILVGIYIFFMVLPQISQVITVFEDLSKKANINIVFMGTLLKIIGIAYIADFGSQICRDAGEAAIASKIEFAAKILVLVMAIPIMISILDTILKLLP